MSVKFFPKLIMFYLSIALSNLPFGRGSGAVGTSDGREMLAVEAVCTLSATRWGTKP